MRVSNEETVINITGMKCLSLLMNTDYIVPVFQLRITKSCSLAVYHSFFVVWCAVSNRLSRTRRYYVFQLGIVFQVVLSRFNTNCELYKHTRARANHRSCFSCCFCRHKILVLKLSLPQRKFRCETSAAYERVRLIRDTEPYMG